MDYREIYAGHASKYDELVSAEDVEGNLRPALEAITPLRGKNVLEVGVGTGRITRLLLAASARVRGFEKYEAMLGLARQRLRDHAGTCQLELGDAMDLPIEAGWADVALAGWVLGHFRHWTPDDWKRDIGRALAEMRRALRPRGTVIIIETLGTGTERPMPKPTLAEYYAWLEREHGFERREIRTDYQFDSVERAAEVAGFFFGEAFSTRVRSERWARIPECTGIWFRHYGQDK